MSLPPPSFPSPAGHLPAGQAPAPGWYHDPSASTEGGWVALRWWDGVGWTPYTTREAAPAGPEPHPVLGVPAALGALAILLVSLIGSRFLLDTLVQFGWPVIVYVAISGVVGYGPALLWCWYTSRRWGTGRMRHDLGIRIRWSDLGWGPLTWVAAVTTQLALAALVIGLGIPTQSNTEGIDELGADRSYVVSILILAVVAAPIVEELVFRGVVLRGFLGAMPVVAAVGLQGVLFGLAHVDPIRGTGNIGLVIILSGVGVVFGVSAYLLRRVVVVMIAHAIFNGVVMIIVLTGVGT